MSEELRTRVRAATVAKLSKLTLGQAEDDYLSGVIGQVEYEAYRRAWAELSPYGDDSPNVRGWTTPSDDPRVEELVADIIAAHKENHNG